LTEIPIESLAQNRFNTNT